MATIADPWTGVDNYIENLLVASDPALDQALLDCQTAKLPPINVTPSQGKMLQLLARSMRARRILEIGTLGGYSAIWMARALPEGGRLITLEVNPLHAEVARGNIARAGLESIVSIRRGHALDTLPTLAQEGDDPFDLIFIDADKPSNPEYFEWAVKLARRGSLIVVDNVVRNGTVADPSSSDPSVLGVRRMNDLIAAEPRVSATVVQTVGSKGYDGFALILVDDDL